MPGKTNPSPAPDFKAAADRPQALARLVADMERLRRNLDMAEAAQARDWATVEKLHGAGADPVWRDMKALRAIADSSDMPAVKLAGTLAAGPTAFTADLPLIAAAEDGNRATVDYILARNPSDKMVAQAFGAALRKDQTEIADLLYAQMKEKDIDDDALSALLIHRPALYAEAVKARSTPPDYIVHFMAACEAKDSSAMYRALDAMQAHRNTLGPNIEAHKQEFEIGMGHQEALMKLVQSGHVPMMARYFENFTDLCPTNLEMFMVISLAVSPVDVNPLQPIVEKFKPDEKTANFAFTYAAQMRNMPALKYLADTFPELAQKNVKDLLAACAAQRTPDAFFSALKSGYKLPAKAVDRAELLAESLMARNKDVAAHLEASLLFTPAVAVRLQAYHDLPVLARVAEAIGDWHFRDDVIFWRAVGDGDRAIVGKVPQDQKISVASPFQIEEGLGMAIARGDFDLVQIALERADWDKPTRELAFTLCLAAPEALQKFDFARFPPRALRTADLNAIAAGKKGGETLALLEERGFAFPAAKALKAAIELNNPSMAEYLLANGLDVAAVVPGLCDAIDQHARRSVIDLIEKWAARGCDIPSPGLAAQIAATTPEELFKGPDSLAVAAAYTGEFAAVMKKAGPIDPALLAATKDARGNSVLDILGAHGRLNDALAPEVWLDRDAAAFMKSNLPPCYLPQCDFNGLQASLRLMRLKDQRPGLKGPGL